MYLLKLRLITKLSNTYACLPKYRNERKNVEIKETFISFPIHIMQLTQKELEQSLL